MSKPVTLAFLVILDRWARAPPPTHPPPCWPPPAVLLRACDRCRLRGGAPLGSSTCLRTVFGQSADSFWTVRGQTSDSPRTDFGLSADSLRTARGQSSDSLRTVFGQSADSPRTVRGQPGRWTAP